jgi:hypothetical protein
LECAFLPVRSRPLGKRKMLTLRPEDTILYRNLPQIRGIGRQIREAGTSTR